MNTSLARTARRLCLGCLAAGCLALARAADQTNLLDILHSAMGLPAEAKPAPNAQAKPTTNTVPTLAPGDTLELTVYQEEALSLSKAVIAKDGTIPHPLLGSLAVGGKTVEDARAMIHDILGRDYLVNPRVSLRIVAYATYRVTVIKEVVRPNAYDVPRNVTLTVMEAVDLAGGPTRLANMSKVTVRRVVNGEKKELKVDAETRDGKAFKILPDDVIEVPATGR